MGGGGGGGGGGRREGGEKIFFFEKYCFVNETITARGGVQGICEEIFFMTIIQKFFD